MDSDYHFDWNHARLFVAVADHGSLSAASRAIGVSQPTIGRAIQALESNLQTPLFARHAKGLTLTEQGLHLIEPARELALAASALAAAAAGRSVDMSGSVRITASQIVATFVLPPMLADLRRIEPSIQIEIVATDSVENLLFREADIALRMVRPSQVDLVTRHVADMAMGLYGSHDYITEYGEPANVDELLEHALVGYDRSSLIIDGARSMGWELDRTHFALRCDDQVVDWNLIVAGAGIGFSSQWVGEGDPRVKRILPELSIPALPIWLTSHAALKTSRRVRFVYDYLGQALAARSRPDPNRK